jgi:hypothetical protein
MPRRIYGLSANDVQAIKALGRNIKAKPPRPARGPLRWFRQQGKGGKAGPQAIIATTIVKEAADTPGGYYKVGNPWTYNPEPDTESGQERFEINGAWELLQGDLSPLQRVEDGDIIDISVEDAWYENPIAGMRVMIIAFAGRIVFTTIRVSCYT